MPRYHKLGNIPPKRHTQFRKKDGSLYYEQLFGTIGFDGMSSNLYHEQRPTQVKEIRKQYSVAPKIAKKNNIQLLTKMYEKEIKWMIIMIYYVECYKLVI